MPGIHSLNISMLLFFCFVALIKGSQSSDEERKVYIVYLGSLVETDQLPSLHHLRMLQDVVDSRFVGRSLVRSYQRSFNGFVVSLTPQEADKLANHDKVISIFPSKTLYPQTTRSWDFMGFSENIRRNPTVESDIIIGVIDTGIWPESESFSDKGFGPPPKKWKGSCKGGQNFTCNNKIIGARTYVADTARDQAGHGSHTASTAAGNFVKDASFYGIAKGTARGAVPSARIAVYKACSNVCGAYEILAAFDDAIADGVDIITISIGGGIQPLKDDVIAIGALHASQKGILVVQAAGNIIGKKTTTSTAPWVFSVAASSTDRGIVTSVAMGNKTILTGKAVNSINETSLPLVYGKSASSKCDEDSARDCAVGCLDTSLVMGKIVLCRNTKIDEAINEAINTKAAGAVAMQPELEKNSGTDIADVYPIATTNLKNPDFSLIEGYFNFTKQPMVNILTSGTVKNNDAPRVAKFSAKGPNAIIPDIIKPDITAPGIEILAAFSPLAPPSGYPNDRRSVKYSIISGTSMSCPHVAGAAAYVKSLHPNWSASAIKSALMTTVSNYVGHAPIAWKMDPKKDPLAEFSYGAGHLDPIRAADPGLVYETSAEDYIKIFCGFGVDFAKKIQGNITCPTGAGAFLPKDLNYPSMASRIKTNGNKVVTFSEKFIRTVTNVGPAGNPTYKVTTSKSTDYQITLKPEILSFGRVNEKKSFEVTVSGKTEQEMVSASLEWSDGVHTVRSPIVLYRDDF